MSGAQLPRRDDFPVLRSITTRWSDEDVYGHVNNVIYYSYFDTAVNGYLIDAAGTDIRRLPAIGVVVETGCRFLRSLSFPVSVQAGLSVTRLGASSITYRIALFQEPEAAPAGIGRFVHVYVDADTRRTAEIPAAIRTAVRPLLREPGGG